VTTTAFCLLDASGRVLAERDAERPFYAASAIKLGVLAAAARAVDAGDLAWSDTIAVHRVFASGAMGAPAFALDPDDLDGRLPPDGAEPTVLELAHAMIARSSNEATNLLVERVGFAAVEAALRAAGAEGCRMQRLFGDTAAQASGRTNTVAPRGLARLMHAAVTGALASAGSTGVMIEALAAQEFPVIAEGLPAGTPWGSKSGWVPGIDHDVAFVGAPGSDGLRVLAVCTAGFAGRGGRHDIRRIAASLLAGSPAPDGPGCVERPAAARSPGRLARVKRSGGTRSAQ